MKLQIAIFTLLVDLIVHPQFETSFQQQQDYIYYKEEIKYNNKSLAFNTYIILTELLEYKVEIENNENNENNQKICSISLINQEDLQFCSFIPKQTNFVNFQLSFQEFLRQQCNQTIWINTTQIDTALQLYQQNNVIQFKKQRWIYEPIAATAAITVGTGILYTALGKVGFYIGVFIEVYYMLQYSNNLIKYDFNIDITFNNQNKRGKICNGVNPQVILSKIPDEAKFYYLLANLEQKSGQEIISWFLYDQKSDHTIIIQQNSDDQYIAPNEYTKQLKITIFLFNEKQLIDDPLIFQAKLQSNGMKVLASKQWNLLFQ